MCSLGFVIPRYSIVYLLQFVEMPSPYANQGRIYGCGGPGEVKL
jgi:hypothetical protein